MKPGLRKMLMTLIGVLLFIFTVLVFYLAADNQDPATITAIGSFIFPFGTTLAGLLLVFTGTNAAVHIFGRDNNKEL